MYVYIEKKRKNDQSSNIIKTQNHLVIFLSDMDMKWICNQENPKKAMHGIFSGGDKKSSPFASYHDRGMRKESFAPSGSRSGSGSLYLSQRILLYVLRLFVIVVDLFVSH